MKKATIIKVFDFSKLDSKSKDEISEFLEYLLELDVPVHFDGDKEFIVVSDKLLSSDTLKKLTEKEIDKEELKTDVSKATTFIDEFDFTDDDDDDFLNWSNLT